MGRNQHGTKAVPTDPIILASIKADLEDAIVAGKSNADQIAMLKDSYGIVVGRTYFNQFRKDLGLLTARQSTNIPEDVVTQLVLKAAGLVGEDGKPIKDVSSDSNGTGHGTHYVRNFLRTEHKIVLPFARVRSILQAYDPAGMQRRAPKNIESLQRSVAQRPPAAPRPPKQPKEPKEPKATKRSSSRKLKNPSDPPPAPLDPVLLQASLAAFCDEHDKQQDKSKRQGEGGSTSGSSEAHPVASTSTPELDDIPVDPALR